MEKISHFNLSTWALRHRSLVAYFILALAIAGVVSFNFLSQSEDPPFTFKVMVIRTFWYGATAEEVEKQITDKIEKKLQETPYLQYLTSYSKNGESTIIFTAKEDIPKSEINNTFYQIRKKIGDIKHTFPEGISGPFFDDEFGDVFGHIYALTIDNNLAKNSNNFSNDFYLKDTAESIRDNLLKVPQVSKVELFGVQNETIYIDFDNQYLASLNIPISIIYKTIQEQNFKTYGSFIESQGDRLFIKLNNDFDNQSVEKIKNTIINIGSHNLRLRDIATIHRTISNPENVRVKYATKNAIPVNAIAIGISMQKGGDIIKLGKNLDNKIAELKTTLPLGVDLNTIANQHIAVTNSVGNFTNALFEAVIVVLAVTFFSLGFKTGFVVALSIPLVLATTFLGMYIFDIGLHKVSLGALVLALGLLVDDAIIAIEMMLVKMESGWDKLKAAAFAYESTAFPMLCGTAATVAGFLPIALAQSNVGEYASAFFSVNATALAISWVSAVIVIPFLGFYLLPDKIISKGKNNFKNILISKIFNKFSNKISSKISSKISIENSFKNSNNKNNNVEKDIYQTNFYQNFRKVLKFCIHYRKLVILITIALFFISLWGLKFVEKQFFPDSNRPELNVELRLADGASLTATKKETQKFIDFLYKDQKKYNDFQHYAVYIGSGLPRYFLALDQQLENSNLSQFIIYCNNKNSRDKLLKRIAEYNLSGENFARINSTKIENGPPIGYPIQYRVSGEDANKVRQIAQSIAEILRQNDKIYNINFNWMDLSKQVKVSLDYHKIRQLNLSPSDVASFITMNLQGLNITTFRENERSVAIVLRGINTNKNNDTNFITNENLVNLNNIKIPVSNQNSSQNSNLNFVYLSDIAKIDLNFEPSIIWRRNSLPTITIRANLQEGYLPATIVDSLQSKINSLQLPNGYSIEIGGSVEESNKGSGSVMKGIPIFVFVVVTLLMLQLQNFKHLLMVIFTAPLGIIGVVLFLLLFQAPLGFMALLGIISLFGMIMRNSVILVDQIHQDSLKGSTLYEAIIESSVRRFRPIILTALSSVLAMIPLSRNDFFGPMAIAIMGGLIIATALTLLFLPSLFAFLYKVENKQ